MRSSRWAALFGTAVVFAVSVWAMLGTRDFEREAQGSTQECNTACQTKMTDCILDCDGVLSCELACKAAAVACVRKCTDGGASSPDLDAGVKGFAPPRTDASDGARDDASDAARIDRARAGSRDH